MSPEAQHAFLFGDPQPMQVTFRSRTGRVHTHELQVPGFLRLGARLGHGRHIHRHAACAPNAAAAACGPSTLAVTLAGYNIHQLSEMPLRDLAQRHAEPGAAACAASALLDASRQIAGKRLRFLAQVGLGYLHLNRPASTLSAGEAQRVRLAGMLGSGLTSLTVLLDEPTRGLHPSEVDALVATLHELRDEGNTVIVVEHDPAVMRAADHLVDMGPGAGAAGGRIVAQGKPEDVSKAKTITAAWLRGERRLDLRTGSCPAGALADDPRRARQQPARRDSAAAAGGAGGRVRRVGIGQEHAGHRHAGAGAGPGQADDVGGARADRPRRARRDRGRPAARGGGRPEPGGGAQPGRVPGPRPAAARCLYAASEDAQALGLDEKQLARGCSACRGSGVITTDMGFLPDVHAPCEACQGTGFVPEAWEVRVQGRGAARGVRPDDRPGSCPVRRSAGPGSTAVDSARGGPGLPGVAPAGPRLVGRRGPAAEDRAASCAARRARRRCTSWTSPRSASTWRTWRAWPACCAGWSRRGTPCWWSSTIRTCWPRATGWSSSGPAAGRTAGRVIASGRPRSSHGAARRRRPTCARCWRRGDDLGCAVAGRPVAVPALAGVARFVGQA